MAEFDDLLGDIIAEVPAAPASEFLAAPPEIPEDIFELFSDNEKMVKFIADTMSVPFEGISDSIINHGYAAVLWKFREAAIFGDIDRTRALKIWLDWAQPNIESRKNTGEGHINNPNAKGFLPREVK